MNWALLFWLSFVWVFPLKDKPVRLTFKEMRTYDLKNMEPGKRLKDLSGKMVELVGYMIPMDDIENVSQFLLLQAPFMGCYHVPPPQAHEAVTVYLKSGGIPYSLRPVKVTGTLQLKAVIIEDMLISVFLVENAQAAEAEWKELELDEMPQYYHDERQ